MTEYEAGLMLGTLIGIALVSCAMIWILNWLEARDPHQQRKTSLLVWLLDECNRPRPRIPKMRRRIVHEIKRIRRKT